MSDSECESPVQLNIDTPWCNWSIMLEDRTCLKVEYMLELCEVVRLMPESGCSIQIGLNIYLYYVCTN